MLIKCPECGHEVSDKAPVCPNCGVKLNTPKKNNKSIYILSILLAILACGGFYYFYNSSENSKEQVAYQEAMSSDDPSALQQYLDEYLDAPQAHRDSIQAHLSMLNGEERAWNDAIISNSRSAIQHYLDEHPNSLHAKEALEMIDSIDWESAFSASTPEALKSYIEGHPNGKFIEEATKSIKELNANTVQTEEKQMVASLFRNFFQGINAKDENRLTSTVNTLLTTFLGKQDATKSDVIIFMEKLWKPDVLNMNWHINEDYAIEKKEVGDSEYELSVNFSATEKVEKSTGITENNYRIKARINPEGKISEFNMSKILE